MDPVSMVIVAVSVILLIGLIRLAFYADGDLLLMLCEKCGKSRNTLAGQVAWVTGASGGIGAALAYELAGVGCKLVLSARRISELEKVKKTCLSKAGSKLKDEDILVLPMDVTDLAKHTVHTEAVLKHFGKIDILVNNAGRSQRGWFEKTDFKVHRDMFELNVFAPASLTKAVLPSMMQRQKGQLVIVSSITGKIPLAYSSTYAATKHALQGWFTSIAVEVADKNIDVCIVCPGPVLTNVQENAFSEEVGKIHGIPSASSSKRMPVERCAQLMVVAMANQLAECWISYQPYIAAQYFSQYFPGIYLRINKLIGMKAFLKVREAEY